MNDIEQIKSRINIVDLIGNYITLKKSGRNFFGLCPFHNENTPSFTVNEEMQRFKCFGCNASGDCLEFIKEYNKVDFQEALEIAAKLAGIELTHTFKKKKSNTSKKLLEINKTAAQCYNYILLSHALGKKYLDYLHKRGLNKDTIKLFQIGCVPGNNLLKAFIKKGFVKEDLIKYGFAVERNGELKDKFRDRVIFPVQNSIGEVVGFTARLIDPKAYGPKYLNSPQTEVYKKSEILYGLFQAKKEIGKRDSVLILEGHMDVLSSFQAGAMNVVGVQGTSLGEEHLNILKRYTTNILFAFDEDTAGEKALIRSIFIAQKLGFQIKVISLKGEKDPDEYIKNKGADAWKKAVEHPIDLIDYFVNKYSSKLDLNKLDNKIEFINKIIPFISLIQDNIRKDFYLNKISLITGIPEEDILSKYSSNNQPAASIQLPVKPVSLKLSREGYLIALIIQNLDIFREFQDKIDIEIFEDTDIREIIKTLLNTNINISSIENPIITDLYIRDLRINLNAEQLKNEFFKTYELLKKEKVRLSISRYKREIAEAENKGDITKAQSILENVSLNINNLMD